MKKIAFIAIAAPLALGLAACADHDDAAENGAMATDTTAAPADTMATDGAMTDGTMTDGTMTDGAMATDGAMTTPEASASASTAM